jgi:hypothetical protein
LRRLAALAAARARYQRAAHAALALAAFARAAPAEDRFGVLQLGAPSLGDALAALLAALGAAQAALRAAGGGAQGALGPWRGAGDGAYSGGATADAAPLRALRDVLATAVYAVVAAYGGESAAKALAASRVPPAHGSAADARALLQAFIAGEF